MHDNSFPNGNSPLTNIVYFLAIIGLVTIFALGLFVGVILL